MKQKQIHSRREQTCVCQGGEMDWKFGVSRCRLLHMEGINNKVLLYSIGNYIQYSEINHNGKNIHIIESICYIAGINNTLK